MLRVYLDTNVYVNGLLKQSNSSLILEKAKEGLLTVVASDYLLDEVSKWFKLNVSKNAAGYIRYYILGLPSHVFVYNSDWRRYVNDYAEQVADKDDLPHICAYVSSSSRYFVTANRRLTQTKVKEKSKFQDP